MQGSIGAEKAASTVRDAKLALRAAWYDAVLSLTEGCEDWASPFAEQAMLMKADVLGRRDRVNALEYLTSIEDLFDSVEGRFERDLAAGFLHYRLNDFDTGDARYDAARKLAGAVTDGEKTLAFHQLRCAFMRRECNLDAPEFALAFSHPDPHIVTLTHNYRGWYHAALGDLRGQIAECRKALAVKPRADEPYDVQLRAKNVYTLALIAFEIADGESVSVAREVADTIAWTPDLDVEHFNTLRWFGWDSFMRGRPGAAQWSFKDARAVAPSVHWQVMAHLDRSYVARIAKNEAWALDELNQADRLARDTRWELAAGEERQVLPVLATLFARVDPVRAQRYAAIYGSIGAAKGVDPMLGMVKDPRVWAFARYAQGLIDLTLGRPDMAVPAIAAALEKFEAVDYHFRSTLAAGMLYEATGEQRWREASIAHANQYPNCPLATFADDAVAREEVMPRTLSPFQKQIVRALINGADVSELSRRFSRSLYTIERQVSEVYSAFDVRTRGELLDVAQARGLA
ncbi:MAG TPA: hypothetical protein VMD91_03930 [Candidatus Sulfotelmatobacter sp.]|nr:hypothetical protein [Candidatus Sulfotelmatobacter sp.]